MNIDEMRQGSHSQSAQHLAPNVSRWLIQHAYDAGGITARVAHNLFCYSGVVGVDAQEWHTEAVALSRPGRSGESSEQTVEYLLDKITLGIYHRYYGKRDEAAVRHLVAAVRNNLDEIEELLGEEANA